MRPAQLRAAGRNAKQCAIAMQNGRQSPEAEFMRGEDGSEKLREIEVIMT